MNLALLLISSYSSQLPGASLAGIIGQVIVNSLRIHPDAHLSVERGASADSAKL